MVRRRSRGLGPVLLTLGKELRETVRDRRTLTVMILFPLVIYPLLALVGTQLVAQRERGQEATASRVAVEGSGALADEVRTRLDADKKLFDRQSTGSSSDVDQGRLDALVRVRPAPAAPADAAPGAQAVAEIVLDATRDESRRAEERLSTALAKIWPAGCAPRFQVENQDLAPRSRMGGYVLSKALPLMILLMVLLGAFYPAIDVTAGERERGTLETVLVAPIPRLSLLFGKVLAVTVLASASGFLNLLSMSLTLVQVVNLAAPEADLPVPWIRAAATGLVVLPTAFLLAALFVAVGSLARGFKEAQNLLVPVYFAFFAPALLGAMGDLKLSVGLGLVPGLNVSLLARDIALGKAGPQMIAVVLAATIAWGAAALAVAAKLYVSERFIAATDEGGGKPVRSWRARLSAPLTDTPLTPGDAFTAFGVGYLVLYFVSIPMQKRDLVTGLMVTQWLGFFALALLYPLFTRRRPSTSLGLGPPLTAQAFLNAALMGLGAWVLANAVAQWVLPPPKEYLDSFRKMLFPEVAGRGVLLNLLLFALTPALCEELLFRGLILRALLSRTSAVTAIGVSAAMFGLFHVDIYRLLPTTLLGVMLGLIAWKSGSVWPSVLAHFLNNGVVLILGSLGMDKRIDGLDQGSKVVLFLVAAAAVTLGVRGFLRPARRPG